MKINNIDAGKLAIKMATRRRGTANRRIFPMPLGGRGVVSTVVATTR